MAADSKIVRCEKCGVNNRVSANATGKAVCGKCKAVLTEKTKPIHITDANFKDEIENSPLPVLLDLWAEWCPPCRMLAPIIDGLAQELSGKVLVCKLDVDKNPLIASMFQARSIPTMLILKHGREVDRIVGLQSREAILQRLSRFIN